MRHGFTTGSCAAAAAKAAAYMLLTGKEKQEITIITPKGIPFTAELKEIVRKEEEAGCGVVKDGGDDPDITTGALVYVTVQMEVQQEKELKIRIEGGRGVGLVTKPGLDQPVGNAAINRVPREMIEKEVREVCELADYKGALRVEVSVPEGEALAENTFNPRLGITGGISILGTSGIVEPMSSQALIDTIRVELKQKQVLREKTAAISPGNYGIDFMKNTYGFDLDQSVKCSNFIGLAIDMAVEMGFEKLLLTGHIGKMVKLAGGIMNTHSRESDCRMELIAAALIQGKGSAQKAEKILNCATTEEALGLLNEEEQRTVMQLLLEKIQYYLQKRAGGKLEIEVILFSNELGELIKSNNAETLLREIQMGTEGRE